MEQPNRRNRALIFYSGCVFMLLISAGGAVYALDRQLWPQFVVSILLVIGVLFPLVLKLLGRNPIYVPNREPGYRGTRIVLGSWLGLGLALLLVALFLREPIVIVTALAVIGAQIAFLVVSIRRVK